MHLSDSAKRRIKEYTWGGLKFILMVSLILLMWSLSTYLLLAHGDLKKLSGLTVSDLAALLFGASSIALFMVSLVIGTLAIFGWQAIIRGEIKKEVSRTTDRRVQQVEHEMRGRVLNALGYMVGETWPDEKDKLKEAVEVLREGYEYLAKVDGPARFLGLNNLLYYSSLYYSCVKEEHPPKRGEVKAILRNARLLLEKGLEHDGINIQMTAIRVILEYSGDAEERERVRGIIEDLKSDERIRELPLKKKNEFEYLIAKSKKSLAKAQEEKGTGPADRKRQGLSRRR